MIKTLAIETSCDDTSLSIVDYDGNAFESKFLLSYSQVDDHQKYGGVVPEVASRLHSEKIIAILEKVGHSVIKEIDFISVTAKPGLPGSLIVGLTIAYMLGEFFNKEVVEVNHILGHIFSIFLDRNINDIKFPLVVLTASGGHNDIYVIQSTMSNIPSEFNYSVKKIGATIDDASGEAFDKVSRMLGGPYPGGVRISNNALKGKENDLVKFNRIYLKADEYNFSFSGMKSQVYYLIKMLEKQSIELDQCLINDICYEFQEAVVEVLANKLVKAGIKHNAKTLVLAGGVSSNDRLFEYTSNYLDQKLSKDKNQNIQLIRPVKKIYSTDNAAMIGTIGIIEYLSKHLVN